MITNLDPALQDSSTSSPVITPPTIYHPPDRHTIIIPNDHDDDHTAQYANPMNDPYAEVELGWRRMTEASTNDHQAHQNPLHPHPQHSTTATTTFLRHLHSNDEVLDQLSDFSFTNNHHRITPLPNSLHHHPYPLNHLKSDQTFNPQSPLYHTNPIDSQPSKTRKLSLPSSFPQSHPNQHHSLNPISASSSSINLSMRRSDQLSLFRPPSSSSVTKTSFSSNELSLNPTHPPSRTRLSSFSTDLEPISASPTSPHSPASLPFDHRSTLPASLPARSSSRPSLPSSHWAPSKPSSSPSSSFSSSEDGLLRRASSSSLASVTSISSTTNGLKARRGLTKPLSLTVPNSTSHPSSLANGLATPLGSDVANRSKLSAFSRSLPPSPRFGDLGQARAQFVGMKANVTGGLSMKRRTSIPRLSLGLVNSNGSSRAYDPVQLIGRNYESSVMNTPVQLHFDPIAAGQGRRELMSSQAGIGGKGHIEVPSESTESFPYEHGPKEVLTDVFLGSEQNARDGHLLSSMGFGLIINVAKEVECPWEPTTSPAPIEQAWSPPPKVKGLMVRPTASTPNLKRSFEGKIRVSLPEQNHLPNRTTSSASTLGMQMIRLDADQHSSRPSLDYVKLPWSHDQDGLAEIFSSTEVFNLIDRARDRKLKTLVHCQCGVSRSATLMIGYCMREAIRNPGSNPQISGRMHDAYSFVKERSPWAGPNMGLIYQLIEYEKVLLKGRRGIVEEVDEECDIPELEEDIDHQKSNQAPNQLIIEEEDEGESGINRMIIEENPIQADERSESDRIGGFEDKVIEAMTGRNDDDDDDRCEEVNSSSMRDRIEDDKNRAEDLFITDEGPMELDKKVEEDDDDDYDEEENEEEEIRKIKSMIEEGDVDRRSKVQISVRRRDEEQEEGEFDELDLLDHDHDVTPQLTNTKSTKNYFHHNHHHRTCYFSDNDEHSLNVHHHRNPPSSSFPKSPLQTLPHPSFLDLDDINLRTSTS